MNKVIKKTIFIIIMFNLLMGCQSLREGLEGNKKSKNAEEFLIEKKNPLVLPPDYSKLPLPENKKDQVGVSEEFDIEKILKNNSKKNQSSTQDRSNNKLEKSIIEKIKKIDVN